MEQWSSAEIKVKKYKQILSCMQIVLRTSPSHVFRSTQSSNSVRVELKSVSFEGHHWS